MIHYFIIVCIFQKLYASGILHNPQQKTTRLGTVDMKRQRKDRFGVREKHGTGQQPRQPKWHGSSPVVADSGGPGICRFVFTYRFFLFWLENNCPKVFMLLENVKQN